MIQQNIGSFFNAYLETLFPKHLFSNLIACNVGLSTEDNGQHSGNTVTCNTLYITHSNLIMIVMLSQFILLII
jgi:hypothetical protein